MGRNASWLSEKQIHVLEWVRDGCPDGGAVDLGRRITARALHRRGLVRISGAGATWHASITSAGTSRLEREPRTPEGLSEVDDLIRRLVEADGRLPIGNDYGAKLAHEKLVKASLSSERRPKGWRLELKSRGSYGSEGYEIVLVRHFDDLVDELPVPIPSTLRTPHPAVKAYLADRDHQMVTRDHVQRAARILQALADEAPRRGLEALAPSAAPRGRSDYENRDLDRAHLVLRGAGGTQTVEVMEVSGPGGAPIPWSYGRSNQAAWLRGRRVAFVSTGTLELIVQGPGMTYGGYRPRDSARIALEERLPRIFRKIEIHRLEHALREEERVREEEDRRRRWEAAMAKARLRYDEEARWDWFVGASKDWRSVQRHREFLNIARAAVARAGVELRDDLDAHLDFIEGRLAALDPTVSLALLLPVVAEPKPDDLKPYLGSWSPHGPERW